MTNKLPLKGKDILALCSDKEERYLFRCACANESCKEWRCSITGLSVDVQVISWKYD